MLRHIPDKHMLENVPRHAPKYAHCSNDLAAVHYPMTHAVLTT